MFGTSGDVGRSKRLIDAGLKSNLSTRNRRSVCFGVCLDKIHQLIHLAKSQCSKSIRRAAIERYSTCRCVDERGDWKNNVRDESAYFIRGFGNQNGLIGSVLDFPRLIQIEQRSACAVDEPVARIRHAVIEKQPTFARFYGRRTGSNFLVLPPSEDSRHDVTVPAPES